MKDDISDFPLFLSAYAGTMDFMVSYLKAGGPVSHRNSGGETVLHVAAQGWQHRMVEFLLQWGADVNAQTKNGDTPLHSITISRIIPSEGRYLEDKTGENAREKTFRSLLLHRETDATLLNAQGINPLHLAARIGDSLAIRELLFARRDLVDRVTSKGATALILAILYEEVECVKLLIQLGADPRFKMVDGVSSIDLLHSSENPSLKNLSNELTKES